MGGRGTATDRGSEKFGSATAGGGGVEGYGKEEQALARKLFGKNMSGAELATLAGADAFKGVRVEIGMRDGKIQVDLFHKNISKKDGMTRTFFKDAKGKLTIENEAFFLNKSAQGKGIGTDSFRTQVQAAKNAGVKNITTFALRNDARADKAVGHIAWGNLGYNAPLSAAMQRAWVGRNPLAQFSGVKPPRTVRELYDRKGGKALWAEKGEGGRMIFSLKRGSVSLKALNGYLKVKGKPLVK
jgi:GNAT superfamily N-acetyltransferase